MKKTTVGILAFAAACVFSSSQEVAYGVGEWPAESGLGNHRAITRVEAKADAVRVRIPWRRRDFDPEKKNVVVIDAATGGRITNVLAAPMALSIKDEGGMALKWDGPKPAIVKKTAGAVAWESRSRAGDITMTCRAQMEFDGYVDLKLEVRAKRDISLGDIVLDVPIAKNAAVFKPGDAISVMPGKGWLLIAGE